MNVELPYGKGKRVVRIPDGVRVDFLTPRESAPLEDLDGVLRYACSETVGSEPLHGLVDRGSRVLILVSDVTRDGGTKLLLPHCIRYLKELGVTPRRLKVLIAKGAHRGLSKEEKGFFKGGELSGIEVEEHDCDNASRMSALTLTSRGTPVRVNKALKEAGLVILLSPISFHYFAGFGGGRKLVLPGSADRASISANHRLSLLDSSPVALNPLCRCEALDGNPVHEDMREALEALNGVFSINFFSNTYGQIVFLNAGSPGASHKEACDAYSKLFRLPLTEPYDVIVLGAGGYPHDIDLLQAHKAIRHASNGLKKGGAVLFLAECAGGVGSEELAEGLKTPKADFLKNAYKKYRLNNQTAVSLLNLAAEHEIAMVTDLGEEVLSSCGMQPCLNLEAFLATAMEKSRSSKVAVIPYGGKTLPKLLKEGGQ